MGAGGARAVLRRSADEEVRGVLLGAAVLFPRRGGGGSLRRSDGIDLKARNPDAICAMVDAVDYNL